jgi:radical SAM superfamily enzyme YgiQ (UPF0313 family)
MKITLINPSHYDPQGNITKSKFSGYFPIAIPLLSSMSKGKAEVKSINEYVHDLDFDKQADLVAISAQKIKSKRVLEIAEAYRNNEISVVVGGPLCNPLFSSELEKLTNMGVSIVFGPAENIWDQVLSDLKEDKLKLRYTSEKLRILKNLPIPDYSDFNKDDYDEHAFLYIESSRGCPNKCSFCDGFQYHPTYMPRPLDDIVRDIEIIKDQTNMNNFHFTDSNLLIGNKRSYQLFEKLKYLEIDWGCSSDMQFMTPDSIVAAAESGCDFISMGVESLNTENLAYCNKSFNDPERVKDIIRTCKNQEISLYINVIFGFDFDTTENAMETVEKLIGYKADAVHFHVLDPTIGTPLYSELKTQNRLLGKTETGLTIFQPKNMDYNDIHNLVYEANKRFYSDDSIVLRVPKDRQDIMALNRQFQKNTQKAPNTQW